MATFYNVAMPLVQKGYTVIPCRPDKGACVSWKEIQTTPEERIREWAQKFRSPMAGILTGTRSGVWVLDLDVPKKEGEADGRETLEALERAHGSLPDTFTVAAPSGGKHLYFTMPRDGKDVHNSAKKAAPGIDVRGSGGYAIAPGSTLPDGRAYTVLSDTPPVPAPDWLLTMVRKSQSEEPRPSPKPAQGMYPQAANREAARQWALKGLEDECQRVRETPQGGRNATLNTAALKVFQIVAGGSLFEEEATRALMDAGLASGLTEQETRATITSGRSAGLKEPRYYPGPAIRQATPIRPEDWPAPVHFTAHKVPKLDPLNLPPILGDFCAALAEEKQVPVEIAVAMALATLAAAAQRRYQIQIREGYTEPVNIYTLCPLEPANRKSATVEACTVPLKEWEKAMSEALMPEVKAAKSRRLTMERAIEGKRSKAAKCKTQDEIDALQREIDALEAALPEVPTIPRILADNTTPEALAKLMEEMGGCICIITAEGGIFDILAGMYSKGVPNLDLFLKAHSGDTYRVDRRQSSPIILDCPHLTLGISPQPVTLAERSASRLFRGRGLDGRFLYFMPESLLGRRKLEPEPMPQDVKARFHAAVQALLPTYWSTDTPEPITLELSQEAYQVWLAFANEVEKGLAPGGDFEGLNDWGGKLAGAVARIAGLFHLVTHERPEELKVQAPTMMQATYLGGLLTEHAKAAYALMGTDDTIEGAKKVLEWIRREARTSFTVRDCQQKMKQCALFSHVDALKAALRELEERYFIWEQPADTRQGPGRRPGPLYLVNPATLKE